MRSSNLIDFILTTTNMNYIDSINNKSNKESFIDLTKSYNFFQLFPPNFTISTNRGSYKFNIELLVDTSLVISKLHTNDPSLMSYHIDINDEKNIMKKIERIYCGKSAAFSSDEIFYVPKIVELLGITNFPNFIRGNNPYARYTRYSTQEVKTVMIDIDSFNNFLLKLNPNKFVVIVNDVKYYVNRISINVSNKLSQFIKENPDAQEYIYNVDDEFNDFQLICNLFKFLEIQITNNNMNMLKQFAEDLEIPCILDQINHFIENYQNAVQTIDDKQAIIESIDQIFDLLYNKGNETIEKVKNSIVNSFWSKTEEDVLELAACILQVIRTDFIYHQFIFDLMLLIEKESNEFTNLKFLIPAIVKFLLKSTSKQLNCAFLYKLYKNQIVKKSDIDMLIRNVLEEYDQISCLSSNYAASEQLKSLNKKYVPFIIWFLPEFFEFSSFSEIFLKCDFELKYSNFIKKYYPDKMDNYKKMRDEYQPEDATTRAIIHDDLNTINQIFSVSNQILDIKESFALKIPFNIFDSYVDFEHASYLNYSAAYGSIHCFKYFLLNHAKIDAYTLAYAAYGGNYEIIRIVDQNYNQENISCEYYINSPIIPAIMKHKNDLFDWILQEKYLNNNKTGCLLAELAEYSSINGNAHSLISCIDNGLHLSSRQDLNLLSGAQNGFYRYQVLMNNFVHLSCLFIHFEYFIDFDNLLIFKLFLKYIGEIINYDDIMTFAAQCDAFNIVSYIINNTNDIFNGEKLTKDGVYKSLLNSIQHQSRVFPFLLDKICSNKIMEHFFNHTKYLKEIVAKGCSKCRFENVKLISDLIIERYPDFDFTLPFQSAIKKGSTEICQYFIDKNAYINLFSLAENSASLISIGEPIFRLLFEKANQEMKEILLGSFLYNSLKSNNVKLVEFILSQDIPYENALFEAVKSHNLDIVKIILKHNNNPSFINQISACGTALNIAVQINDAEIVQYLLSIPGIDPNLYHKMNQTPLIAAISNCNMKIINILLDYYGDSIQEQMWQLNLALETILSYLNHDEMPMHSSSAFLLMNDRNDISIKINKEKALEAIKRLLEIKNINLNCRGEKYTILIYACEVNDIVLVKMLIKTNKVDLNLYSPFDGNTALMTAIKNSNTEIAELLIKSPQVNINQSNFEKETALTIAVKLGHTPIIKLLLKSEKFNHVESRLDYAFFIADDIISNLLLSVEGLDVNYRHLLKSNKERGIANYTTIYNSGLFETSLIYSVLEKNINKLKLIIEHPSFDPAKSQVKTAIFTSVKCDQLDIFRELIPLLDNDVNIKFQNGVSLLLYSVEYKSEDIVAEIIGNANFDPIKSNIKKAFLKTFSFEKDKKDRGLNNASSALVTSMNSLYTYDEQHDKLIDLKKLLPNGKSYFTSINNDFNNIENVVSFLLNNGAEPDCPDENGVYPLEHAIKLNSYPFVHSLIQTNSINFTRIFSDNEDMRKNSTYLHLAAKQANPSIFIDLLNLNIIDINAEDSNGETALHVACNHLNSVIVQKLFLMNDLDYKHCNENGFDAIKIAQNAVAKIGRRRRGNFSLVVIGKAASKDEYFSQLMTITGFPIMT